MKIKDKIPIHGFLFLLWFACTAGLWGHTETDNPPPRDEAGYIHIEPIDFYFQIGGYFSRLTLTSSRSRIWYTFQAADENSSEKPLFVFFNGGPGGSTTSGLMSMYTSRYTLDNTQEKGGDRFIPNPVSWTRLGNLLYIDARQTGFSHDLTENPGDMGKRLREFNAQNYNAYTDAADFIRVILRFLDRHPEIRDNPVILVGESYGGIRATVILYILLNYSDFTDGFEVYQDEALVREIQGHYNDVFPAYRDTEVPAGIIAGQFTHQVLVQPAVSMPFQRQVEHEMLEADGSLIFKVAEELGVEYVPCRLRNDPNCNPRTNLYEFLFYVAQRDAYNVSMPRDWLDGFFTNAGRLLGYTENLYQMTGVDVTGIPELYASARLEAYRVIDPDAVSAAALAELPVYMRLEILSRLRARSELEPLDTGLTPLEQTFGTLQPWDCYYLDLNHDSNVAHNRNNIAQYRGYYLGFGNTPLYGRMFLRNVGHVKTFITNAKFDVVIYGPAIPRALGLHTDILAASVHDSSPRGELERPGRIILYYRPGVFEDIPGLDSRNIRFPFYENSAHAVSITEPVELFNDVSEWLINGNYNLKGAHGTPRRGDPLHGPGVFLRSNSNSNPESLPSSFRPSFFFLCLSVCSVGN